MRARLPGAALVMLVASACGSSGTAPPDDTGASAAASGIEASAAASGSAPAVAPDWQVRLPARAGAGLVDRAVGPVVAGALVLVGSSHAGVAAVDLATGALRWQQAEHAPETPIVIDGALWLPGQCAHAAAGQEPGSVLGCVEVRDPSAQRLIERAWLPAPEGAWPMASQRRALGAWDGQLLWAHGAEILALAPGGRELVRYRMPAADERVCGHHAAGDVLPVASCRGLAEFGRVGAGDAAPRWYVAGERSPSVAGPIQSGALAVWAHGETLEAVAGGQRAWRAQGRFAHAPGAVQAQGPGRVVAVSLDGGLRPALIDAATGAIVARGDRAPGIQVLWAASTGAGAGLVMAVRLDTTLRRDAVVAYDTELRLRWSWPVPEPEQPRIEPVTLAATAESVIVFHDGRHVARLPLAPAPAR